MHFAGLPLYALPTLYALFVWWFSTGIIIYLDNLPRATHRWSLLAATVILAVLLYRIHATRNDATIAGAYMAFTCGLLAWGWQEMSFFMGFVTGPAPHPCPADCTGWPLFVRAVRACLYHELASIAFGAVIIALTYGGANQVGTWTYMVLWSMRMSAKLNVLLGVRNLSDEFVPEHLAFIRSFLRQKSMNLLFPVSVSVSTVVAVLLVQHITSAGVSVFAATGSTFLAALMILAVIEHWFLVVPLPAAALWNWSLPAARRPRTPAIMQRIRNGLNRRGAGFPAQLPQLAPVSVSLGANEPIGGNP